MERNVRGAKVVGLAVAAVLVATAGCSSVPLPPPSERPPAGASLGCTAPAPPVDLDLTSTARQTISFAWGGETRRVLVQLPAGLDAAHPAPLLLSLHPFLLVPEVWEAYSGLGEAAVGRGEVVVTPEGSSPGPRWAVPGGIAGSDDLGFLAALIDSISDRVCIDGSRVFAAGFSAGAAMAEALGCAFPDRIAAVVASGGANLTSLCPDAPGVDTLILHGTADPIAPPTGSQVVFAPPLGLAISDVVTTAAARNGCDPLPATRDETSTVRVTSYRGCSAGRRVEWWQMSGAGHTWAGPKPPVVLLFGAVVGSTDTSISATDVALNFFDSHRAS